MLHKTSQLYSQDAIATDGDVGNCVDIIMDDRLWAIRYLVINTGNWLNDRKVLISPTAVIQTKLSEDSISTRLTKNEIENSPPLDADAPVSREYEIQYNKYFGYHMYWLGPYLWGPSPDPYGIIQPVDEIDIPTKDEIEQKNHLRSCKELTGYDAYALNDEIGKIEDFIFDERRWSIKYVVVNTGNWLFSDYAYIPVNKFSIEISWPDNKVTFNASADEVQKHDHIEGEDVGKI